MEISRASSASCDANDDNPSSPPVLRKAPDRVSRRNLTSALASAFTRSSGGAAMAAGWASDASASITPTEQPPATGPGSAIWATRAAAARFLLRAQFSASSTEIDDLMARDPAAWLRRQMRFQNDISATEFMKKNNYDIVDQNRYFRSESLVDPMIWNQLLTGGNTLRKRVALALSQYFVVSANNLNIIWPSHAVAHYWDLLNDHAFGNFRNLLEAVTLSPAMGAFLSHMGSRPDDPATGRKPDENFAREIMQLFTIGLYELRIDGSLRTNFGVPVETYSNEDVMGLARVFTGYNLDASNLATFADPERTLRLVPHPDIVRRPMTANNMNWQVPGRTIEHSLLEKTFLGITVPPATDAPTSLRIALDHLFNHPNVGPFFARQMIQRLVTSNPNPRYIQRVAQTFNNNGRGVRGDLAAVFRAILLDPDASNPIGLNDFRFGKLREPAVRFIQVARTSGMTKSEGRWITRDLSNPNQFVGQVPMRAPSVFNFFRPQYVMPRSIAAANNMVSPEFQGVTEATIPGYLNTIQTMLTGSAHWLNDMKPEFRAELPLAAKPEALVDHLDIVLTAGQLRPWTRERVLTGIQSVPLIEGDGEAALRRVQIAYALILCSHDYLVQK